MVNNSDTKVSYKGNGQTTVFPFSFPFIQRDYIKVAIYNSLTDETKIIDSDYYVDTVANAVIYPGYEPGQEPAESLRPPILPATSTITIYRQTDVDQLTDLGEKYPLKDIENMADKLTEIIQEQAETLGRAVKVPVGDPKTPEEKLTDLQNYVSDAANSAKNAATSEASAQRAAEAAATSEANAAESERIAGGYADTATAAAGRAEDSAISARAYTAPDYDNEKTYQAGDVVTYTDGNSYRALKETTGNEPSNIIYWQKVTDYVGDNFFEVDEYGYIVPMDSPSHSRYWRVDQNGYIVPIEGGDGGYRPDTRSLSAEYLNVANEGYVKHLRADDISAQEVDADEMTAEVAAFNTLTANAVNAGTVTANDIIAKGPIVDVRAFGAKGDGVTDDTAAFRSALLAAQGKMLIIPQGSYLINEKLFADGVNGIIDNGSYNNLKPIYPTKPNLFKSTKQLALEREMTIDSDKSVQGICYNSNTKRLITAVKNDSDTSQILYVINPATNAVDNTYNYTALGHCNSLTYCEKTNKIYVVKDTTNIAVINADTMAYETTIVLTKKVFCLKYDADSNIFVGYFQDKNSTVLYIRHFDINLVFIKEYSKDIMSFGIMNGMLVYNQTVLMGAYNYYIQCDYFADNFEIIESRSSYEVEDFCYCIDNNKIYVTYIPSTKYGIYTLASFEKDKVNYRGFFGESSEQIEDVNLNEIIESGTYNVMVINKTPAELNFPDGVTRGVIYVERTSDTPTVGNGTQLFINFTTSDFIALYARRRIGQPNTGGTWGRWYRLDARGRRLKNNKTSITFTDGETAYNFTATADGVFEFRGSNTSYLQVFVSGTANEFILPSVDSVKAVSLNVKEGDTVSIRTNTSIRGIIANFTENQYVL